MAGIKISALPPIPVAPLLTDIFPEVQPAIGGVTYKTTFNQLLALFGNNITISESQVTNLIADLASKLPLAGGTMSGAIDMGNHFIHNVTDPVAGQDAATKAYVDTFAQGITVQGACRLATTASLTALYANGAAGIGATLTNSGALAALTIDGVLTVVGDRILVKDQVSAISNGIYVVTNVGSGAISWIMTRAADYNEPAEIQPGDLVIINAGTVNGGTAWVQTATVTTIGISPINWSQFTVNPSVLAGNYINNFLLMGG